MIRNTTSVACLASLYTCSLFAPSQQSVPITATDPNTEILVNGNLMGRVTVSIDLPRNKSYAFMAKIGDRAGFVTVDTNISGTGVLDIIGELIFLIPLIGIADPGFWHLDSTSITIVAPPAPTADN